MTSPYVTIAILDTIRGAGFHVGWTSAVDVRTGESFTAIGRQPVQVLWPLYPAPGLSGRITPAKIG